MVQILGNDDVTGALLGEDLRIRSALEEQTVAAGRKANNDVHGFLVAREGDRLDDLGLGADFLPVLPTENFGELKKGGFSLGPNESKLFGLRIDVLEGGTGGEGSLTQWVHCEFVVSFEAIRPVITQQVCGKFF